MNPVDRLLNQGLTQGVFDAAELLVARQGKLTLHQRVGSILKSSERFFDLASLTKPLATAILLMQAAEKEKIDPQDPLGKFYKSSHLGKLPLARFLNHTSGLIDWFDFTSPLLRRKSLDYDANRDAIVASILRQKKFVKMAAQRSEKTIYSDLGYILLGAVLEKAFGKRLDRLFVQKIARPLGLEKELFFRRFLSQKSTPSNSPLWRSNPLVGQRGRASIRTPLLCKEGPGEVDLSSKFVPSEICLWRDRILQGEVMDENAWSMGGVSGHAGLFGTAKAVHRLLTQLRLAAMGRKNKLGISQASFARFCAPDPTRKISERVFTLGFDTPTQPSSQSGKYFSPLTIGHLGYSGTSFWWDLEKDVWIILLTNRCYPSRNNVQFNLLRPQIHDAVFREYRWS